ncbi:MAG: hypothetical protein M0R06_15350 [Sphaerochaeta sp.]|jgi:hypothetical protein|nr:hypothetical protein [Sphaerochaeta sp.]
MTTVADIVKAYLEKHGLDGLVNEDGECSCFKDDLAPCGYSSMECRVGRKIPCPNPGTCEFGCGPDDYHIQAVTPEERNHEQPGDAVR